MTTADVSPLDLRAGAEGGEVLLGGYRVESLLRRRSYSDAVYLAVEADAGREVELRVVSAGGDPGLLPRFEREVVFPASIEHPNLPPVYSFGESGLGVYMATARLEGATLEEIAADGGLPPLRAVRLLGSIAEALDEVHRHDLSHGDVRAGNVLVVARRVEHPYLMDFGLRGVAAAWETPAAAAAADVRAFAATLSVCLDESAPPALRTLLDDAASGAWQGRSAGELTAQAAGTLVAKPASGPGARTEAQPLTPPSDRPRRRLPSVRVPALAAAAMVLAAGAAGFVAGRPADEGEEVSSLSAGGVEVAVPEGWRRAADAPALEGLDLERPVALEAPDGRTALVAGRLRGLEGSVHPAEVARRVDARPPRPRAVALDRYQALRFSGLDARGSGRITLFVAPTGGGTLAAACLPGAPRACPAVAASLELAGAPASSLDHGQRFAGALDRVFRDLDKRRTAAGRRLRGAQLSPGQARAAEDVAGAHRTARRSLVRLDPPPAARAAQRRLAASLASVASGYRRLSRAAERQRGAAFSAARRSIRRSEAKLRTLLRTL